MLYTEFMNKVCKSCIFTNEITGKSFIAPCYKLYMKEDNLNPKDVTDIKITYEDVLEYMKLEVERINILNDRMPMLVDFMYDLVFNNVSTLMNEESNEMAANLIEYMKLKKELDYKKELDKNNNSSNNNIKGFNYSKKKID